jgi:hypothetical protein
MHTALRATSLTLLNTIATGITADAELRPLFDLGAGGTLRVVLATSEEMAQNGLEGVSLWLYRIVRDDQRLNAPPIRVALNQLQPTPLPVRLHYLVTPVIAIDPNDPSASAEREQTILGKVLQILYERPLLRGTDLRDTLAGTTAEVGVRLESNTLDEVSRIWSALHRSYELSVSYEVTVVHIEPAAQPLSISPVRTAMPRYGVVVGEEAG